MKIKYLTNILEKGIHLQKLSLVLAISSMSLFSCTDLIDNPNLSPQVSFTSEISSSWEHSADSLKKFLPSAAVTTLQYGEKKLFLHTTYADSIVVPLPDKERDSSINTRATPITDKNMYASFGVSAYAYKGPWDESQTPNFFYDVTATKSGASYTLTPSYYWPGKSFSMKFFAYSPKGNGSYVFSGPEHIGSPTIKVSVPSDVAKQYDLIVAASPEIKGDKNTSVPLTFNHALTAVKFVCGDDMQGGIIYQVKLKNVYSTGTYNMGNQQWNDVGTLATFSQTLNKVTSGTPDEALTTDAQTFMMIPQTLPDNAQLEVQFRASNVDYRLTVDIKGTSWPKGKTVTYKLSSSSINWTYKFRSGPTSTLDYTYTGGTRTFSVISYRYNHKGVTEAVPWSAQFSTDGGITWTDTQPDWLTAFPASGPGGKSYMMYDAVVNAQIGIANDDRTSALQSAPVKGSENSPYNLANQTDGGTTNENTANCYVVSSPGYYSFPLVYGNAIKNSATNESAYKTNHTAINHLSNFVNHTGNAITDPCIRGNTDCTPYKAELVWQDARDLVSDITYNATNDYISFKVDKSSIQQGNAVIAIKDASDKVLWSWHIWVTDSDINKTIEVTNFQNYKYKFMPVDLGWCGDIVISYAQRSCRVRLTAGNKHRVITIKQNAELLNGCNSTHYQWGRKDPFLPSNGLSDSNKIWYDKDGNESTSNPASNHLSTLKDYILNPNVIAKSYGKRGYSCYMNLWNANKYNLNYDSNIDENIIKTIYDPSPVGFKLPGQNAFTGFTNHGENTNSHNINGFFDSSLNGWHFFTNTSNKETIFFFMTRRRYNDGNLHNERSVSAWTACPFQEYRGYSLSGNLYSVDPTSPKMRSSLQRVRPVQE